MDSSVQVLPPGLIFQPEKKTSIVLTLEERKGPARPKSLVPKKKKRKEVSSLANCILEHTFVIHSNLPVLAQDDAEESVEHEEKDQPEVSTVDHSQRVCNYT